MSDAISADTEDLAAIADDRVRVVRVRGEDIEVRPLTLRRLVKFAPHARKLVDALNAQLENSAVAPSDALAGIPLNDVIGLVHAHTETLVAALAAAIDKPEDWLWDADLDDLTALTTSVFATNLDFFSRRLLPRLLGAAGELADAAGALRGRGQTPSPH